MQPHDVEFIVRRLFADADFRARAIANPAAAFAEYELGSDERAALTALCSRIDEGPKMESGPAGYW